MAVAAVALASPALAIGAGEAAAVSNGRFVFAPVSPKHVTSPRSSFYYEVAPGQVIQDSVELSNLTDSPQRFLIYAADAYNTPSAGTIAIRPDGSKSTGVGSWITLPVSSYKVPARTAATFTFVLRVPENVAPGDHVGGIVALDLSGTTPPVTGRSAVTVRQGIGLAVVVRVHGHLAPAATISGVGATVSEPALGPLAGRGRAVVRYQLTNTGNTVLNGSVAVHVTDLLGQVVERFPARSIVSLVPGSELSVVEPTWRSLALGPLTIVVSFTPSGSSAIEATGSLVVFPWALALVVVFVLVSVVGGASLGVVRRARRRRRERATETTPAKMARSGALGAHSAARSRKSLPRVAGGDGEGPKTGGR